MMTLLRSTLQTPLARAVVVRLPTGVWRLLVGELRAADPTYQAPTTAQLEAAVVAALAQAGARLEANDLFRAQVAAVGRATWLAEEPYRAVIVAVRLTPDARAAFERHHRLAPSLSAGQFAGRLLALFFGLSIEVVDTVAAQYHRVATASSVECQVARAARAAGLSMVNGFSLPAEPGLAALLAQRPPPKPRAPRAAHMGANKRRTPSAVRSAIGERLHHAAVARGATLPTPEQVRTWREQLGSRRVVASLFGVSTGLVDDAERPRRARSGTLTHKYVLALQAMAEPLQAVAEAQARVRTELAKVRAQAVQRAPTSVRAARLARRVALQAQLQAVPPQPVVEEVAR